MIDRNFLLAFASAMLLVLLYNFYYQWRFGEYLEPQAVQTEQAQEERAEEPEAKTATAGKTAGPETGRAALPAGETEPAAAPLPGEKETAYSAPAGAERLIRVDTGLTLVTLSNKGAVPVSYKLKEYDDVASGKVDIIFNLAEHLEMMGENAADMLEGARIHPTLGLRFPKDSFSRKINKSYFKTPEVQDEIVLGKGSPPRSITFELADDSGVVITKTYTFHPGAYRFDFSVSVKSAPRWGKFDYSIVWFGLGEEKGDQKAGQLSYTGPIVMANGERVAEAPEEDEPKRTYKGEVPWAALVNRYYTAALAPEPPRPGAVTARYVTSAVYSLEWAAKATIDGAPERFEIYAGPKEHRTLGEYTNGMYSIIDYGWFDFIAKPLFWVMNYFHKVLDNWGWSIIALTVLMKLLFFPLTQKGFKSMQKLQKLQPHMKKIQETYKDDKERLNRELMNLYREHRVNPLGGCLPMILQIPIFFALYKVLLESIEMKGAGWILWIKDLSKHDPYYVTPVLMGASMLAQQLMTPKTGDPTQRKIMMALPFVFTFLFLTFPSGLVIYWLVNNILTIGQQWVIYRDKEAT
ncbi:MAG: membrane protein insertase YidC [Candidatus Nitrospinota bacterium M3_3B_026]